MHDAADADLTEREIDRICHPLTQGAAQARFLRSKGLTVRFTAGNKPLVNRRHYDEVMNGRQLEPGEAAAHGPAANDTSSNVADLRAWAAKRKVRNAQKA